jgi:hypothetical protein
MIKHFAFALSVVFAASSVSFAAYPVLDPFVSGAPSVLIKADVPAEPSSLASDPAAVIGSDAVVSNVSQSQPMPSEDAVIESEPMAIAESTPSYRVVRPSRRSNNGVFSELIELERRKNAWLRKNILGK